MQKAGPPTQLLLQPSVSGVAVSLFMSGLTVNRIFEFGILLYDCFVYHQYVTCLKHSTRLGSMQVIWKT